MSFLSLLISSCTIQAKTLNQSGYEKVEAWTDIATGVPTRKDRPNSPKFTDTEKRLNIDDDLFYFMPDVLVSRGDRIIFDGDTYDVLKVNKSYDGVGVHHLEVTGRDVDYK